MYCLLFIVCENDCQATLRGVVGSRGELLSGRFCSLIPPGEPPYTPNDLVDQQHVLIKDIEKLRYFIKGFYDNLNQTKREQMFVELLERVAPDDAKLLVAIKDKKMPSPGITIQHVKEGLPGLIAE